MNNVIVVVILKQSQFLSVNKWRITIDKEEKIVTHYQVKFQSPSIKDAIDSINLDEIHSLKISGEIPCE